MIVKILSVLMLCARTPFLAGIRNWWSWWPSKETTNEWVWLGACLVVIGVGFYSFSKIQAKKAHDEEHEQDASCRPSKSRVSRESRPSKRMSREVLFRKISFEEDSMHHGAGRHRRRSDDHSGGAEGGGR